MTLLDRALSEEHYDVLDRADSFVEETLAPRTEEIERTREFPRDVVEAAGDAGLLGILIPEAYGGLGGDFVSYCLVLERVAEERTLESHY